MLAVSRNTVVAAYEELAADDLVRGIVGSGTHVQGIRLMMRPGLADWRKVISEAHFPSSMIPFNDVDGNRLYLNPGQPACCFAF
jgi:DNA-binding transcriptional MocR family regulator